MTQRFRDYLILFALWLLVFSSSSQIIIVSPILGLIGEALDIPEALRGLLVTSYAVMVWACALVIGPISDKVGRRRVLLLGTAWMAGALALHGVVESFVGILVVRGLAGMAGGFLSGAAVSYVGDYFPYEKRGWANGWVMSGTAFGQVVGIPLGILLAGWMGFRAPFLMFAVTMVGAFVLVWRYVPQPNVERETDRLTVLSGLKRYGDLLKKPVVVAATIAFFLMFASLSTFVVYLPTWLESAFGFGESKLALLFLMGGAVSLVAGPTAGWLSDRIGRKPIIVVACGLLAFVIFGVTLLVEQPWLAYPMFMLVMMLFTMRISPLQALMTALVPGRLRGTLFSLALSFGQVGIAAGSAVALLPGSRPT